MERKINIGFGIDMSVAQVDGAKQVSLRNSVANYTRVMTPFRDYNI